MLANLNGSFAHTWPLLLVLMGVVGFIVGIVWIIVAAQVRGTRGYESATTSYTPPEEKFAVCGDAQRPRRSGMSIVVRTAVSALIAVVFESLGGQLFNHFAYQRHLAWLAALPDGGPVAKVSELNGNGQIYLVPLGSSRQVSLLNGFARRLHADYGLDVQVLPPVALDQPAPEPARKWNSQAPYVAELLYDQIKQAQPNLARDPHAYLIGVTDADMYSVNHFWARSFTQRDLERVAVISTARMEDDFLSRTEAARMRRISTSKRVFGAFC